MKKRNLKINKEILKYLSLSSIILYLLSKYITINNSDNNSLLFELSLALITLPWLVCLIELLNTERKDKKYLLFFMIVIPFLTPYLYFQFLMRNERPLKLNY